MNIEKENNTQISDFEKLLSVILVEGQGCECPHKETCGHAGEPWCRYINRESNHTRIIDYRDLSLASCVYREHPGCCWVLAAVEKLSSDYLVDLCVDQPPVPIDLINAFDDIRKVEMQFLPLKCVHGAAWLMGDEWVIQVSSLDSPQVRRHTIFHEAFHIACRSASPSFKRYDLAYRPFRDVLADHFATCILMPKKWLTTHWAEIQDIQYLAGIFDVSISAMEHRLGQLGLINTNHLRI